jgi:hypothetical protein
VGTKALRPQRRAPANGRRGLVLSVDVYDAPPFRRPDIAQDLAVLAPFIDQVIAGKGPPPILSAEYEDTRPATLGTFRARMQAEGLWPREAVAPDAATET